jgi:secreted trypsin-like serine protease
MEWLVFAGKGRRAVGLTMAGIGCCLAIAGGAAASFGPSERIVGGDVANPADWPFIAAIASRGGNQFCGGSVVAEEAVVTAAHCVMGSRPGSVRVITGRPDLDDKSQGQMIKVEKISVHRDYLRRRHHDIAVLNLKSPADVPPVLLPTVAEDAAKTEAGDELRVAGWGGTDEDGGHASDVLLDVALFAISDADCSPYFDYFVASEEVCAFGESQGPDLYNDSCYGDSGGPLVADAPRGALLIGAVSYGGTKCGVKKPGVYAQIAANLNFIERKAGLP